MFFLYLQSTVYILSSPKGYGNTVDPFNWLEDDYIREGYYPARIGSEVILGLATGGATKYAQGAGYMAKVATAVCLLDTVGNATSVGQGVNDVIRTGSFSLQNTVQILGGGLGLTGNFFGAATKIKAKAPETNMGKNPEAVIGTICATCFVAGTQVVTDEGLKNIEDIKVGDFVLSKDPTTGKTDYKPVVQLIRTQHSELLVITYKDANGDEYELKVSREHPFWVADKGWVAARQLSINDKLVITDETVVSITNITLENAPKGETFTTHNFEVDDYHTYFVLQEGKTNGAFAVLVHNAKKKCEDRLGSRGPTIRNGKIIRVKMGPKGLEASGRPISIENARRRVDRGQDVFASDRLTAEKIGGRGFSRPEIHLKEGEVRFHHIHRPRPKQKSKDSTGHIFFPLE